MPTYSFRCIAGHVTERVMTHDQLRHSSHLCDCGQQMDQLIEYPLQCAAGHQFSATLTRFEFLERDHVCCVGGCQQPAKRALIPVPGGVAKVARNKQYPYYNWQLPFQTNPVTGKQDKPFIVESAKHEADIVAGKLGTEYRINQI